MLSIKILRPYSSELEKCFAEAAIKNAESTLLTFPDAVDWKKTSAAIYNLFRTVFADEHTSGFNIERQVFFEATITRLKDGPDKLLLYKKHFKAYGYEVQIKKDPANNSFTLLLKGTADYFRLLRELYHFILLLSGISEPHAIRHEVITQEIIMKGSTKILDLGCGAGAFFGHFFDALNDGTAGNYHITGLELKEELLGAARQKYSTFIERGQLDVFVDDITSMKHQVGDCELVTLIEVIEHLQEEELLKLSDIVFGELRPSTVLVSTPNADYNVFISKILINGFRHEDHQFEWDKQTFLHWGKAIAEKYGYTSTHIPLGPLAPNYATISQLLVFNRHAMP